MQRVESARRSSLIAAAVMLIVAGLLLAVIAPGGPLQSNKAHAYGEGTTPKPTNPKNVGACDAYHGKDSKLADARECRAIAVRNAGNRKCAKKKGSAKKKCKKAVARAYGKATAAVKTQRTAEKACAEALATGIAAISPTDPEKSAKEDALGLAHFNCLTKARA